MVLALVFGHSLMKFAQKHCELNQAQYGSSAGKQCQSAVLNKILPHDIFKLLRKDGAMSELDVIACYDQIILALVVLTCRRLGLGISASEMLLDALRDVVHRVRTGHSVSVGKYAPRDNMHHFGTGQGSRGSPSFWRAILEVILNAVDTKGEGMVF